jgi:hypothetical protein
MKPWGRNLIRRVEVQPGDIVFVKGTAWISRAIRWLSRSWGEAKTEANHVGVITSPVRVPLHLANVTEALHKVRTHSLWDKYAGSGSKIAIYRSSNLGVSERRYLATLARNYTGLRYGYLKIVLHYLDARLLNGMFFFRRLAFLKKFPICSYLVAAVYSELGLDFGVGAFEAQPDDIWDFVTSNPDKYRRVLPWTTLG